MLTGCWLSEKQALIKKAQAHDWTQSDALCLCTGLMKTSWPQAAPALIHPPPVLSGWKSSAATQIPANALFKEDSAPIAVKGELAFPQKESRISCSKSSFSLVLQFVYAWRYLG